MENAKEFIYISAAILAALFFIFKFITGQFLVNLSLNLSTIRSSKNELTDYLEIKADIEKGLNNSIELFDLSAKVEFDSQVLTKEFVGIRRQSFNNSGASITWKRISKVSPNLSLVPSEKTHFSVFFEIPKEKICTIEVCLIGKKTLIGFSKKIRQKYFRTAQWKASAVSIPV